MQRFSLLGLPATIGLFFALASAAAAQTPPTPQPGQFRERFVAANTTHDGCLTFAQAQAANMLVVTRNFPAIDTAHRGCVTLRDIAVFSRTLRPPPAQ